MTVVMEGQQLVLIYHQIPERVHLIFPNGLIEIPLQLYQARELGQKMDFQAQKEPRRMPLELMKMEREWGEPRKMSLESSEDPAVLIWEVSSEAAGSAE